MVGYGKRWLSRECPARDSNTIQLGNSLGPVALIFFLRRSLRQDTSTMSSSDHSNPLSSELERDLAFYSGLTFVLEPKRKSAAPSEQSLQSVITKLDQNATTTKDPRSKNHWLRVTDGIAAAKIRRLLRRNSDFGDFTVREIRPASAEETRIRLYITKWLASATSNLNILSFRSSRHSFVLMFGCVSLRPFVA